MKIASRTAKASPRFGSQGGETWVLAKMMEMLELKPTIVQIER